MNIDCLLTAKTDDNPGTVYKLQNRKKTITQLLCFTLSVMRQQFLPHIERKTARVVENRKLQPILYLSCRKSRHKQ